MPPIIEFLTWADGAGANVTPQATYATLPAQQTGVGVGEADPAQYNKTARQAAHVAAAVANLIGNVLGANVLDDGNLLNFWSLLWQGLLAVNYFVDTGAASALLIAAPFDLAFPVPVPGTRAVVRVAVPTTGPATLLWMGHGPYPVVYSDGTPTASGDLKAGMLTDLCFDGVSWQILSVPRAV
jgi:hypothetical protein